jgi:hypothetical protein
MKIRITGQGLKKAQFLNSQIDTPQQNWKAPQSLPNQNPWMSNSFDWTRKPQGELDDEPKSPNLSNIPRVNQTVNPRYASVSMDNPINSFSQYAGTQANTEPFQPKTTITPRIPLPAQSIMGVNGSVTTTGNVGDSINSYSTVQDEDNLDETSPELVKENPKQNSKPKQKSKGLGMGIYNTLELGNAFGNLIQQPQKQRDWYKKFRDSNLTDNAYAVTPGNESGNRGDYDINNGMFRPNETGFKSKGMYTNNFSTPQAQFGTTINTDPGFVTDNIVGGNDYSSLILLGPSSTYGPKPIRNSDVSTQHSFIDNKSKGSISVRNNNPGNMMYSPFTKKFGAEPGSPRPDGEPGNYAYFPDLQHGLQAQKALLTNKGYANLDLTHAINRWITGDVNRPGAYTANTIAPSLVHKKVGDLTNEELDIVQKGIVKNEDTHLYKILKQQGIFDTGGETSNMKICITAGPDSIDHMAYGGQKGYGFDLGQRNTYSKMNQSSFADASNTIQEVPRDEANIEAEKGETVYGDLDGDGILEQKMIGGRRHSEGGTTLNVPEGSFIFSDTKKMKIKDSNILKYFGKTSVPTGGITPADIAKQYNITKYKAILQDPLSDPIAKKTAEMMITNMNAKLSKLADIQEGMKGFPQGRPKVATDQEQELEQAAYGGYLQKYQGATGPSTVSTIPYPLQTATQNSQSSGTDYGNINGIMRGADLHSKYPWFKPFNVANTKAGHTTPTNQDSLFIGDSESQYERLPYWEKRHGSPFKSMDELQGYIYDEHEKSDPSVINNMWNKYGETYHGPTNRKGFVDNKPGRRTFDLLNEPIWDKEKEIPQKHDMTYDVVDNSNKGTIPNVPGFTPTSNKAIPDRGPWWLQDKINLTNATANWAGNKKYLPYIPDVSLQHAAPTFEDWRGQAGALQSGYQNNARVSGIYGPSSALNSNLSSLAGQQAEQLAGVIGGVGAKNTATANQFAEYNTGLTNSEAAQRAQNRTKLWEGNVIANQQYDNANREGRTNFVNALNQGFTNAANTYNLNMSEPYFRSNPSSGGFGYFVGPGAQNMFNKSRGIGTNENQDFLTKYNDEYKRANQMFAHISDATERNNRINHYLDNFAKMHTETNRATTGAWGQPKGYTEITKGFN